MDEPQPARPVIHMQAFRNAETGDFFIPTMFLRWVDRPTEQGVLYRVLQQSYQRIQPDGQTTDEYVWQDIPVVAD